MITGFPTGFGITGLVGKFQWRWSLRKTIIEPRLGLELPENLLAEVERRVNHQIQYLDKERNKFYQKIADLEEKYRNEKIKLTSIEARINFLDSELVKDEICFRTDNNGVKWPKYSRSWPNVRKRILERDGYRCGSFWCRSKKNLFVHHKRSLRYFRNYREADHPDNLITLCQKCHEKKHWHLKSKRRRS